MNRYRQTLRVGDRKVVTTANKRFHVAYPTTPGKLKVSKRTDSTKAVLAEARRLRRIGLVPAYVFDRGERIAP